MIQSVLVTAIRDDKQKDHHFIENNRRFENLM